MLSREFLTSCFPDFFRVVGDLKFAKADLSKPSKEAFGHQKLEDAPVEEANLVTSLLPSGKHKVCLDLDMDAVLVPSSTEGHHHLIINHELSWDAYKCLLAAFYSVGLVEKGFYEAAAIRELTSLRPPWVKKGEKKKS